MQIQVHYSDVFIFGCTDIPDGYAFLCAECFSWWTYGVFAFYFIDWFGSQLAIVGTDW